MKIFHVVPTKTIKHSDGSSGHDHVRCVLFVGCLAVSGRSFSWPLELSKCAETTMSFSTDLLVWRLIKLGAPKDTRLSWVLHVTFWSHTTSCRSASKHSRGRYWNLRILRGYSGVPTAPFRIPRFHCLPSACCKPIDENAFAVCISMNTLHQRRSLTEAL